MTDQQLREKYNKTKCKTRAMLWAMYREKSSLAEVVQRLKKMGYRPELSLMRVFGTSRPELVPETAIREYARAHKIATAPEGQRRARKGIINNYCRGCFYLSANTGDRSCDYLSIEHRRRGCPAGDGCDKRKLRRGTT